MALNEFDRNLLYLDLIECFFVVSLPIFNLERFGIYEREQFFSH